VDRGGRAGRRGNPCEKHGGRGRGRQDAPGLSLYLVAVLALFPAVLSSPPMSGRRPRLLAVVAVIGAVASVAAGAGGCGRKPAAKAVGGVSIEELKVGSGATATSGKVVSAHYTGRFPDGTKFDSSYDAGAPIDFLLGSGKVIKGWDIGIEGMRVGGKRKLTIPPELAYGARGGGPIPPNATLVFDVELVAVK